MDVKEVCGRVYSVDKRDVVYLLDDPLPGSDLLPREILHTLHALKTPTGPNLNDLSKSMYKHIEKVITSGNGPIKVLKDSSGRLKIIDGVYRFVWLFNSSKQQIRVDEIPREKLKGIIWQN